MPEYELMYWPITGLGEPIRILMTVGGIPFKDTTPATMDREAFMEKKKSFAPMQIPILLVDGKPMDQSKSILRYLGKIIEYEGKPLYPTDPMEAFECDNLIDLVEDMRAPMGKTFGLPDGEREAARAALIAEDGPSAKFAAVIDSKVKSRIGGSLTIGDIYCFVVTNMFRGPSFLDGFPEGSLDRYENLTAYHDWVAKIPPIMEYYKNAEAYRVTMKPFS
jgi:glutathione S-transferase